MKILIIEDERPLAEQLCGLLGDAGYAAFVAENETEAERVLSDYGDEISIAIVDMKFPAKQRELSMDESGLRIVTLLTTEHPEIVSIIYTGHDEYRNAMKCMAAGASYYLEKDPNSTLLLEIVKRAHATFEDGRRIAQSVDDISEWIQILDSRLIGTQEAMQRVRDELSETNKRLLQIHKRRELR